MKPRLTVAGSNGPARRAPRHFGPPVPRARFDSMLDARERLIAMRERILAQLRADSAVLTRGVDDRGEDTTPSQHPADVASDLDAREELVADELTLETRLRLVDDALERVAKGAYGTCVDCRSAVAAERLEAIPYAARCIDCQRREERRA